MGMFDNLKNDELEKTSDRLGGFQIHDTDAYDATIKMAYGIQSQHGAKGVVLEVELGNGSTYRETIYVTNRAGENFYLNPADKTKKVGLPGYVTMNDICLASTETPLFEQAEAEKIVKIWDNDAKTEMPKSVPVLIDLIGKPVTIGLLRILENKSEKDGAGVYQPVADTREANSIDKVFHTATKLTMVEAANGNPATFYEKWVAKNKGQIVDKRKLKDGASAGAPRSGGTAGAPAAGGATAGKAKSLFGS